MIAHIFALVPAAIEAGIKVPPDDCLDDMAKIDRDEYPHFAVFVTMQVGAPMPTSSAHWENAKVIAAVPDNLIRLVTPADLRERGFQAGYSLV